MKDSIRVGAVVYAPKVTVIWELIEAFFAERGISMKTVFYRDYEMQVKGLCDGEIDIAWNSPLAYLDAHLQCAGRDAIGPMRDTDRDRHTVLVVRKDSGFSEVADLKGATIGFGAEDSPQARLIPIYFLHTKDLEYGKDYVEKRFDIGVGLHGDHVGGELDAVQALMRGEVDAAFTLDLNWEAWCADGTVDQNQLIALDRTPNFDHCIFSVAEGFPKDRLEQWSKVLMEMDYSVPEHKTIMDMEGLKRWMPGRREGFAQITAANAYLSFLPSTEAK